MSGLRENRAVLRSAICRPTLRASFGFVSIPVIAIDPTLTTASPVASALVRSWSMSCMHRTSDGVQYVLSSVTFKAKFWERAATISLNDRQIKVLNRMLDGFEGKMTSSKWAKIGKCSQDSANRDIAALLEHGLLERGPGGGRNTHYVITQAVELVKGTSNDGFKTPNPQDS